MLAVLGVAGTSLFLVHVRNRRRRRILALDWPDKFKDPKHLANYCKVYFANRGWNVVIENSIFDFLLTKSDIRRILVIMFTDAQYKTLDMNYVGIERDYKREFPGYFLSPFALKAERRRLPVIMVTDFVIGDDLAKRCNELNIYPLFYKDLPNLERVIPADRARRRRGS